MEEVQAISGYDFAESESNVIPSVSICDGTIAWAYYHKPFINWDEWNDEVATIDTSNGATWTSSGYGLTDQQNPDMGGYGYEKYLVFEDTRNGNPDIYMYRARRQSNRQSHQ